MDVRETCRNRHNRGSNDHKGMWAPYVIRRLILLVSAAASVAILPAEPQSAKIGLVLSAGGALGMAHIGVLKVLERENIPISFISANSMGAIIGGLYAAGYSPVEIESVAVNLDWENLLSTSTAFGSQYLPERQQQHKYVFRLAHRNFYPIVPSEIISLQKVEFILIRLLAEREYNAQYNFDSLAIPLRIIAVDLNTGCRVILKQGSLEKAIRGSIAIPGVFAPEMIADKTLIDGGVLQYLPVDPITDFNPDIIIASLTVQYDAKPGASVLDVISRTTSMVGVENIAPQRKLADIVVEPTLNEFEPTDYSKSRELIIAGEQAAETALPAIRELLRDRTASVTHRPSLSRTPPYLDTICFEGLTVTKPGTVLKITTTRSKTSLDFNQLSRDLEALFNTGFFKTVNYRIESVSPDTVNLIYEFEEIDYGFYYLGLRYDNDNNAAIGIEAGQRNLNGSGIGVRAAVTLGDPNEYRAGLTNIRLHVLPFSFRLDCFWNSIDRSYYEDHVWLADYNVDNLGTLIELGQNIGRDAFFLIGFTAYQSKYRFPAFAIFDTMPSSEWIVGPTFSWEINTHDDQHMPSRGASLRVTALYGHEKLGGRSSFVRVGCASRQLVPLTTWLLWNSYFDFGQSYGELPWSCRFYTGGDDCTGYRTETFTTAGKTLVHAGFDTKILSAVRASEFPLYLQLFVTAVSFTPPADYIRGESIDPDDFHLCVGAGVRMNTPIGPVCLKIGFADLHERSPNEDIQSSLYLSIGRDFRYIR